jgi:fucose permease
MALTLDTAPGREDRANARTQVLLGSIGAGSPYLLGILADQRGLTTAFTLVPVLLGLCVLLLFSGLRAHR